MRTSYLFIAAALCALTFSVAAAPSRRLPADISSPPQPLQLLASRSRDSDPADRNPWGLPVTYEGHKRVYRTDILRETGQQPKWLQEKEAAKKKMENLRLRKQQEQAGHVRGGGSSAGRYEQGQSSRQSGSARPYASALRETATSSAKGAVKAGKTVIRSAKGALRKGTCFLGRCWSKSQR